MTVFHYQQHELCVEDIPCQALAKQYGTPLFVYSEAAIEAAYSAYVRAFSQIQPLICYAVKANSNLSVLRWFAQQGAGFDIVSQGELARVLAAGGLASQTVFSGVGKTPAEMAYALKAGIHCFNVESLNELDKLNHVAGELGLKAPISLRINPDVDAQTHPYISTGLKGNKFGIAFETARSAYRHAQALPNLNIIGIDCHIGSQLTETQPLIDALDRLLVLVDQLNEDGIVLQHIDIGGGIGICYHEETPPDLGTFAQIVESRLAGKGMDLVMEPGRSLIGNAGILISQVEYLKTTPNKNFAVVDAAMNDLMRPSLYSAYHNILPVTQHTDVTAKTYDVVGPICESSDFLGKERCLALKEGDLVAILSAGAYGSTMSSNYNTRPRAAEVWVSGQTSKLIRRRETLDEILANERALLD